MIHDTKFLVLNLGESFCSSFYTNNNKIRERCETVAEGLANNGLKLGISTILTKCKDSVGIFD